MSQRSRSKFEEDMASSSSSSSSRSSSSFRRSGDQQQQHHDERSPSKNDVEKVANESTTVDGDMDDTDEAEGNFRPRTVKFWTCIICIFLPMFLVALDRTIIGTAIPQITSEFQSLGDIGWYGSAYQLTTSASQLVFGRVYKFHDTKQVFLYSILVFEIGSVICGAAPNSSAFIIGRAIAGLGAAGIFSGAMIVMIPMIPLRKRPVFQGLFGMVFGLASVMGPLIGGAFTTSVSWRWCFYINLPIGAVAAFWLMLALNISNMSEGKETGEPAGLWDQFKRLDPLGTFFFVPSIVCLLLALQWGGSKYAWGSARIIALLVIFVVLWLAFAAVQILMPRTATVPARIITQRSILAATIFMFALAGCMMMAIYFLPLWFQVVLGVSASQSGVDTIPYVLSLVAGTIISGIFTRKVGYYVPSMIASPSIMAVGVGLMSTFRVGESSSHWIAFQFLAGFGLGLGMQASTLAAQSVLPKTDVPTGIAIMFFAQQLGGAIFTSVGQNLLSTLLAARLATIPGLDASDISSVGATDLLDRVPAQDRDAALEAYNHSITRIFLCAMAVALVGTLAALSMEWRNINHTGPAADRPSSSSSASASPPPSSSSTAPVLRAGTGPALLPPAQAEKEKDVVVHEKHEAAVVDDEADPSLTSSLACSDGKDDESMADEHRQAGLVS